MLRAILQELQHIGASRTDIDDWTIELNGKPVAKLKDKRIVEAGGIYYFDDFTVEPFSNNSAQLVDLYSENFWKCPENLVFRNELGQTSRIKGSAIGTEFLGQRRITIKNLQPTVKLSMVISGLLKTPEAFVIWSQSVVKQNRMVQTLLLLMLLSLILSVCLR